MPARVNNSAKGNPASHRMSNLTRKARRAARWERAEKRRADKSADQAEAAKRNRMLRERGDLTPWEVAKAARASRRSKKAA